MANSAPSEDEQQGWIIRRVPVYLWSEIQEITPKIQTFSSQDCTPNYLPAFVGRDKIHLRKEQVSLSNPPSGIPQGPLLESENFNNSDLMR
ncbi:hypothetical protein M8J75_006886 [Diaphorina citri]|nr:hypothetical protein M8J75_006886 [Diaphorina citri]